MSDELSDRFAGFYRADADPWSYETSSYEADKYRATLAALPDRPIRRALEMGCSIGVFTEMLAERCGELVAADFSAFAVKQTRKRLAGRRSVRVERRDLRDSIPAGPFDVVVCSEILYYWSRPDVESALDSIEAELDEDGAVVAVNWSGNDPTNPLDAVGIEAILDRRGGLRRVHSETAAGYRLGRWERSG